MGEKDYSRWWHHNRLNVSLLQAFQSVRGYPRHSHDYYVVALVDSGSQGFVYNGSKFVTPVNGLIFFNPGDVHTGEPVDEHGYSYRAFYPTIEHMQTIAAEAELGAKGASTPYFAAPRADDPQMSERIRALFTALCSDENPLEAETRFLLTLVDLMKRYGGQTWSERRNATEHAAVQQVRDYIHEHYAQPVTLDELSGHVNFSRYYLLHTFRDEMGIPPHQYLESVRVREAQKLLITGVNLADAAHQVGFSSQSHFTRCFKHIIGITPGVYARHLIGQSKS